VELVVALILINMIIFKLRYVLMCMLCNILYSEQCGNVFVGATTFSCFSYFLFLGLSK
jgi:hypothetical protein